MVGLAGGAWGQSASAPPLPPTQALDAAPAERLFDDWGGLQTDLLSQGISLKVDAITEFDGNVSGGTRQGSTFANQVGFNADINWERLAGLTGLSTHLTIVNRSGSSDSHLFGDNLSPVQEIYGSGGDVGAHLVSFYAQETLYNHALDIEVGRMNVENDFASSSLYCFYVNNGLCGDPKAAPAGDIGHSAYPDAAWATRLKVRPIPEVYMQLGVYEVNQGLYGYANFRSGWKFDASQDSGVYIPAEIGWEPALGADAMPGHYKLGIGYDTSSGYKDFSNALAEDGVPGYANRTRSGNIQFWALVDQMLFRNGPGADEGVVAMAGYVLNDPNHAAIADELFAGVLDRGFWAARPKDAIGVLFMHYNLSNRLGGVQAIEQGLDLPYSNGATGIQAHETILEADYQIHVFRGLQFEPNFQYVFHPNAQANIRDATVFGFRAYVNF